MTNEAVLAMHAEEAPFLWASRDHAVQAAHYTLDALVRLDDRVQAHLEGLQVDADAGARHARRALATLDVGTVFMGGALAFQGDEPDRVRDAFAAASGVPDGHRPLASALAWQDDGASRRWRERLLKSSSPQARRVAVDASRLCRSTTVAEVLEALDDRDPQVRAAGARAAGECRLAGAIGPLRARLQDGDDRCRFWTAWSLTLLDDADGLAALIPFCEHPPVAWRAIELSLRVLSLERGRELTRRLAGAPFGRALMIGATGVVGDPQALPWLLGQMNDPVVARIAGEAFSGITGVDLERDDLSKDAPDLEDADEAPTSDTVDADGAGMPPRHQDSLSWPDVDKLKAWWDRHRDEFRPGQRHLCGQPVSVAQALHVLKHGRQRERAAAALELSLLEPSTVLFDVRARGRLQRKRMAPWSS
ncbi:TIGR02270 family protein [Roseateles chitosanitabidus]|uniref:TIGR02270 family protein n=1 Tax=Roseateles chitosanitabidus TaxID=65048 RepID=UPI0014710883|nr:TIGR02270 family protein [Roseateles chitosanitabidus]MBO9685060.1 TIGR02270 family protein [Roseateles chitosanitabidus]